MNLLHTSDWHLGHRLHEQLQQFEQEKFLEWLIEVIKEQNIDILLVSGDIFDTGYPSAQSLEMFYGFLARVYKHTDCQHIVMTAGNHDAPGTLNAPNEFVRNFSIHLVGKATEDVNDEILEFDINGEKLVVAAVPFLRDRDIRRAIAGENAEEIETRYKKALTNHYNAIANAIEKQYPANNIFVVAMGHLFAVGGQPSESEHRIYVGGLGDITASDFPRLFQYVALGHLHRPQTVNGKPHIRYSGSPVALSFDEAGSPKKVVTIETQNAKLSALNEIEVPVFRSLFTIKGGFESCKQKLEQISNLDLIPEPWAEVLLTDKNLASNIYSEINNLVQNKKIKVLKVQLRDNENIKGLEKLIEEDRKVNDLKPKEIFLKKCEECEFDLKENPQIADAFDEILNIVTES